MGGFIEVYVVEKLGVMPHNVMEAQTRERGPKSQEIAPKWGEFASK